jgi:hypothetical protein
LYSAVIDPTGQFAYFGTYTSPGQVVKFDLTTFRRVGAITLEAGEDWLFSAVIDPAGQYAYFGTATSPGRVVKIDLATFSRVGAITLDTGENDLLSAAIDPNGQSAYFGTTTFVFGSATPPARLVKVDLDTFSRAGAVTLEAGEHSVGSVVIDPAGQFAYLGIDSPAQVVKVDLATFERIDAITLEAGEMALYSAVIDPAGEYVYLGTSTDPARVVKVAISGLGNSGALAGTITAASEPGGPCLIVGGSTIDFGTHPFNDGSAPPVVGTIDGGEQSSFSVENCGDAGVELLARGTNAVSRTSDAAWALQPITGSDTSCTVDGPDTTNVYGLINEGDGSGSQSLSTLDTTVNPSLAAGDQRSHQVFIQMPCVGSDGAGETFDLTVTYTAVEP